MDSVALLILIGSCIGGATVALLLKLNPLVGMLLAAAFTLTAGAVSLYHELLGWVAGALMAAIAARMLSLPTRKATIVVIGAILGALAGVALGSALYPTA